MAVGLSGHRENVGVVRAGGVGPSVGRVAAAAAAPLSLEQFHKTVTEPIEDIHIGYELARCGCNCWFCPGCCIGKGYKLRAELVPLLKTFQGLLMISLTVDPQLFTTPKNAYLYMRERRCVSVTMQDLRRSGHLHSARYFYVVEWQKETEQAHFHVLLDASFVPHKELQAMWSKHRPSWAGSPSQDRPGFGWAWISKPRFVGGALHAARYATKYLIKTPESGFPEWVLSMGGENRVKRFGTSRPFWDRPAVSPSANSKSKREPGEPYAFRIAGCEETSTLFEVRGSANCITGEVAEYRRWVDRLTLPSWRLRDVPDARGEDGRRRLVLANSVKEALRQIEQATGSSVQRMNRSSSPKELEEWAQRKRSRPRRDTCRRAS